MSEASPVLLSSPSSSTWRDLVDQYFGSANELASTFALVLSAGPPPETEPHQAATSPSSTGIRLPDDPDAACGLINLPSDALDHILLHLGARDLTNAAQACRTLFHASAADALWEPLFCRSFAPLCSLLGLAAAAPRHGERWREHYFEFCGDWAERAYRTAGRVLLKARTSPALAPSLALIQLPTNTAVSRSRGVAPAHAGTLPQIDGAWHDATPMLLDHPGGPELLAASAGRDATQAFEYTNHSDDARRQLRRLQLEAQPPSGNLLASTQRSDARRREARRAPALTSHRQTQCMQMLQR